MRCDLVLSLFSKEKAIAAQRLLSRLVKREPLAKSPSVVGAVDVSYMSNMGYGAFVALSYPDLKLVGSLVEAREVCLPYMPGLLAFREMEVLAPLLRRALHLWRPDVILVDGHGIAHPRGLGIASHIGVAFDVPTIGVAKSKLVGHLHNDMIMHEGRPVGIVKRIRGRELFVSPGHRITLEESASLVDDLVRDGRLIPLEMADKLSRQAKYSLRPPSRGTH